MFPSGIQVAEYERALRLLSLVGEKPAAAPVPATATRPQSPPRRSKGHHSASKEVVGQIAGLLGTGKATAMELSQASGLHPASVYAALREMGAVEVERRKRPDGIGRGPAVWSLPSMRTP